MEIYNLQANERRAMEYMLSSYCRHHHGKDRLCVGCLELHSFVCRTQPECPNGQAKVACQNCQQDCLPARVRDKLALIADKELGYLAWRHPLLALSYWRLRRRRQRLMASAVAPVRA